jgi:hypothetical protein
MNSAGPTVPWSLPSDARTTLLTTTVGVGLLVFAWWESSGTGNLDHQTTWVALGVLAVFLIGMGTLFWVLSGLRALRLRCEELMNRIENAELVAVPRTTGRSVTASPFVAIEGSGRYHQEDCLLIQGKEVHPVPSGARTLDGLQPCEMCEP